MSKALVAFFSSSGETKEVAEWIVEATGNDCYEIKPAEPYTEADLNYTEPDCRATADVSAYDTVLLGFPIWFYAAPRVVNSFIEQTDLAGKKIIPFATSGMGGLKEAVDKLKAQYPALDFEDGKCFENTAPEGEIKEWANTL